MDYLCRDSFFTGVQEGRVASERLLKMLDVRNDRLVVQVKGIYSVEKFLVARRLMYWQVYLHKTSVAAEQHLIKILSRAKELAHEGKDLFCSPSLRYFLYQHVTFERFSPTSEALEQYALLDDNDVLSAIKAWIASDDKVLSLLSRSFINRQLFRGELLDEPLTDAQKTAFYTSRYHLGIAPNMISDVGETPFYSTLSLWDTFRAAHPLYTILSPERVSGLIDSILKQGRKTGFMPIWCAALSMITAPAWLAGACILRKSGWPRTCTGFTAATAPPGGC